MASLIKTNIETVYLSVPLNFLTLRELDFPFSDKNKIMDTISYELEGVLLGDIREYSIDHTIIESAESRSKVLAVCLEKTRLRDIIDVFSSAGLEPKVVTSVDLRISRGKGEKLLEEPTSNRKIREEASREELLNPSVNLRQYELAYTGDIERFKNNLKLSGALALILLILVGALAALRLVTVKKDYKSLTKEVHTIYKNVFPGDKKIIDVERQLKGNLNILMEKKTVLGGIPVLDILRTIAVNKNNDNITLYEFSADGKNILIKGIATSFEDVESLKKNLASAFHKVKVMSSDATADKKINFTIIMQEKTV